MKKGEITSVKMSAFLTLRMSMFEVLNGKAVRMNVLCETIRTRIDARLQTNHNYFSNHLPVISFL